MGKVATSAAEHLHGEPVHHSLPRLGGLQSMGPVGSCFDNVAHRHIQREGLWRTPNVIEITAAESVDWHEGAGGATPVSAEDHHYDRAHAHCASNQ